MAFQACKAIGNQVSRQVRWGKSAHRLIGSSVHRAIGRLPIVDWRIGSTGHRAGSVEAAFRRAPFLAISKFENREKKAVNHQSPITNGPMDRSPDRPINGYPDAF
jgi:hypothetical protein